MTSLQIWYIWMAGFIRLVVIKKYLQAIANTYHEKYVW